MKALLGLWPLAAALTVLGAAILADRLREPHRNIRRPFVVVDNRTLRYADRRYVRLSTAPDHEAHVWAHAVAVAACLWLRDQVRMGPARKRILRASQMERWERRRDDALVRIGGREFL